MIDTRLKLPDIKLTVKAIVRWEQMAARSFYTLNYANEEDMQKLLYCCLLCASNYKCTYEEFLFVAKNERFLKKFLESVEKNARIAGQFKIPGTEPEQPGASGNDSPEFVKDVVFMLIDGGLDPDYILNRADMCDIAEMVAARSRSQREKLNFERLWTFCAIKPHIDNDKFNTPSDLIHFPWDDEKNEKPITDEEINAFDFFIQNGGNITKH